MAIKYDQLNVDEKYSGILEPNLYFNPVMVPGVTFTDKYQTGPAGQIFVHKITTSAVEAGTPGRDFSDAKMSDALVPIQLNNNFQRSYKIYGVQAAAVASPLPFPNAAKAGCAVPSPAWQRKALPPQQLQRLPLKMSRRISSLPVRKLSRKRAVPM